MEQFYIPAAISRIATADPKNKILRHLAPEMPFELAIFEEQSWGMKVTANNQVLAISRTPDTVPSNFEYVLKPRRKVRIGEQDFRSLKMEWIKHPMNREIPTEEILASWKGQFTIIEEDRENHILGLRQPQVGAIYATLAHWRSSKEIATVVLPTGTGKTETMLSLLVGHPCNRLLVIVPSDSLRQQITGKFLTLGLLKKFGILSETALNPFVGMLNTKFAEESDLVEFVRKSNVVVTTMQLLSTFLPTHQRILADEFSHLFIDEAHHAKATTWEQFRKHFKTEQVVQFTATPYRNDGERLDGKIIFQFPLSEAQKQGYFTTISFIPIREYDPSKADQLIAEKAVEQLRSDIANGQNHILMARCQSKSRADEVYRIYQRYSDLNPVKIYTGVPGRDAIFSTILAGEAKIIVAVDMLGEGFDLPQLKVAAFHDIRKSLPITLQFAGRFTRTAMDTSLGNATFIANIADSTVIEELEDLYSMDADWNQLLPNLSNQNVVDQQDFSTFINGFSNLSGGAVIPFQNIRPALSAVVFRNPTDTWFPRNFAKGIPKMSSEDRVFSDYNQDENTLIVITARKLPIEWGKSKELLDIKWDIYIIHWETQNNLLFINTSDNSSLCINLANAILDDQAILINDIDVFKVFHGIDRLKLQNVGLKEVLGKYIRWRMMVGGDIEEALSRGERQRMTKSNAFGVGYVGGKSVSIGCSLKGRIWTNMRGDLKSFKEWCYEIGRKLTDQTIDPNTVLLNTITPSIVWECPQKYPICIDWNEEVYKSPESRFSILIGSHSCNLHDCELIVIDPSDTGAIVFALSNGREQARFKVQLTGNDIASAKCRYEKLDNIVASINFGITTIDFESYLDRFNPTIWFFDGSSLAGNLYFELRQDISPFDITSIEIMDWAGVDLAKESQGVSPKLQDSIQFKLIQSLLTQDFDLIYDDDYSGEIADIITIKERDNTLFVQMYHLKFAVEGRPTGQIKNFYEVCGQAQKSTNWVHSHPKDFFEHLFRRKTKVSGGHECSRLEKGDLMELERLAQLAKRKMPMKFEIFIVQPGLSKQSVSQGILTLLGVTSNYLKETSMINLKVIASQ